MLLGSAGLVGILILLALIYGLTAREMVHRTDRILHARAQMLINSPPQALQAQITQLTRNGGDGISYFGMLSSEGRPLLGNLRGSSGYRLGHIRVIAERPGRHGAIRMLATRLPSGQILLIGRDIAPLVDLRRRVFEAITLSALIVIPLILIAAFALSIAPLRRVARLQRSAEQIAGGRLEERMPILGRGDELDLFATIVNHMVEEVGRVVSQVKSVTDAVAHDLRTPLTRVRAQLYRASQQPDIGDDMRAGIEASLADLDSVIERFAALLRISELEASGRQSHFVRVSLDRIAPSVVALYEPLAEDKNMALTLDADGAAEVLGDQSLLFEALSNLVDNAIKFTPEGGHIAIVVRSGNGDVVLEVRDDGPGVAEERRQAVLRRFDRGGVSSEIPGTGLGLSVVAAILHIHQFTLELDDAAPGLIVRITAPALPSR